MRLLRKFRTVLPKTSKLFIRPHFDHGDIIHDQAYKFAIHQKLESREYNVFLEAATTSSFTHLLKKEIVSKMHE